MITNDIVSVFREYSNDSGISAAYHSFIQIPQAAHCFATWDIVQSTFYGADNIALFRDDIIQISFFYKDGKKDADFTLEQGFEAAIRYAGEYSKKTGYNSDNNLFYSEYTFKTTQEF